MHARTHARTHTHARARTHTHTQTHTIDEHRALHARESGQVLNPYLGLAVEQLNGMTVRPNGCMTLCMRLIPYVPAFTVPKLDGQPQEVWSWVQSILNMHSKRFMRQPLRLSARSLVTLPLAFR